eukprot:m.14019 g.14019  ORF g.14019 m.14019 type:complete len:108 (+) comp7683_c0_seq4:47-370(+)
MCRLFFFFSFKLRFSIASCFSSHPQAVFLLNCFHRICSLLDSFTITNDRLEMIEAQMDAHIDTLMNAQAQYLGNNTGLSDVLLAFQTWQVKCIQSIACVSIPSPIIL